MLSDALLDPLEESFAPSAPMCQDCAFEPYCGADPAYHHATSGDYLGRKPTSGFCRRNMAIFELLLDRYEADPETRGCCSGLGPAVDRPAAARHERAELDAPLAARRLATGRPLPRLAAQRDRRAYLLDRRRASRQRASASTSAEQWLLAGRRPLEPDRTPTRARTTSAATTSSRSAIDGARFRVLWRHSSSQNSDPAHRALQPLLPDVLAAAEDARRRLAARQAFELIRLLPRRHAPRSASPAASRPSTASASSTSSTLPQPPSRGARSTSSPTAAASPTPTSPPPGPRSTTRTDGRDPDLRRRAGPPRLRRPGRGRLRRDHPRHPQPRPAAPRIEIRVVLHKQTAPAPAEIAEFIARNLPFVEQVALMGLEMIGFARANIADALDRSDRIRGRAGRGGDPARPQPDPHDDLQPPALPDPAQYLALRGALDQRLEERVPP